MINKALECLLCRRAFNDDVGLRKHVNKSKLHKENLDKLKDCIESLPYLKNRCQVIMNTVFENWPNEILIRLGFTIWSDTN